jgi:hypothetical protein
MTDVKSDRFTIEQAMSICTSEKALDAEYQRRVKEKDQRLMKHGEEKAKLRIKAAMMYRVGMTSNTVGEILGCSPISVLHWAREDNAKIRPHGAQVPYRTRRRRK